MVSFSSWGLPQTCWGTRGLLKIDPTCKASNKMSTSYVGVRANVPPSPPQFLTVLLPDKVLVIKYYNAYSLPHIVTPAAVVVADLVCALICQDIFSAIWRLKSVSIGPMFFFVFKCIPQVSHFRTIDSIRNHSDKVIDQQHLDSVLGVHHDHVF